MRSTFPSASYPACGDDRMYDLHHGLLGVTPKLWEVSDLVALLEGAESKKAA